jgi:hypothetical protein
MCFSHLQEKCCAIFPVLAGLTGLMVFDHHGAGFPLGLLLGGSISTFKLR